MIRRSCHSLASSRFTSSPAYASSSVAHLFRHSPILLAPATFSLKSPSDWQVKKDVIDQKKSSARSASFSSSSGTTTDVEGLSLAEMGAANEKRRKERKFAFFRDVVRALYRMSQQAGGTPHDPKWVPLARVPSELSDDSLEHMECFPGGLKEVLQRHIPIQTEVRYVRRDLLPKDISTLTKLHLQEEQEAGGTAAASAMDSDVVWFARIRPYSERLMRISSCLDAVVQSTPELESGEKYLSAKEAIEQLPNNCQMFCRDTFETPLEALQEAKLIDSCRRWRLYRDGHEHVWRVKRDTRVPGMSGTGVAASSGKKTGPDVVHVPVPPPPPLNTIHMQHGDPSSRVVPAPPEKDSNFPAEFHGTPALWQKSPLPQNVNEPEGGGGDPQDINNIIKNLPVSEHTRRKQAEAEMLQLQEEGFQEGTPLPAAPKEIPRGLSHNVENELKKGPGRARRPPPPPPPPLSADAEAALQFASGKERQKQSETEHDSLMTALSPKELMERSPFRQAFTPYEMNNQAAHEAARARREGRPLPPAAPKNTPIFAPMSIDDLPGGEAPPPVFDKMASGSATSSWANASVTGAPLHQLQPDDGAIVTAPKDGPNSSKGAAGGILSIHDLMQYIPPFFIPVSAALEHGLSQFGYTHEHIQRYVGLMLGIQLIEREPTNPDACFIRVTGFLNGQFSMRPCVSAMQTFQKYQPLPSMARPFLKLLPRSGSWVTLKSLMELAGKEAEESLPFQGPDALMYFSQMQHIFVFSPERGGIVARRVKPPNLFTQNTSCPFFYNELVGMLNRVHRLPTKSVISSVAPEAVEEMQRCFPSWQAFAAAHGEKFGYLPETDELTLTSTLMREKIRSFSLEEQLEHLLAEEQRSGGRSPAASSNRRRIRQLKRRLAQQRNPDNPLLDPERLAAAILDFVPDTFGAHISAKELGANLSEEIKDLLPNKGLRHLLLRYPEKFTLFDWRRPENLHVMRAGTGAALPAGALRADFSPEEVVSLCVQMLMKTGQRAASGEGNGRGAKMKVQHVFERLPFGAKEALIKKDGLVALLRHYPDTFLVVSSGDLMEVVLLQAPDHMASAHAEDIGSGDLWTDF